MSISVPTTSASARDAIKVIVDSYKSTPPNDEEILNIWTFENIFFEEYSKFQYRRKTFANPTQNAVERLKLISRLFDDVEWPNETSISFDNAMTAFFNNVNVQRSDGKNIDFDSGNIVLDAGIASVFRNAAPVRGKVTMMDSTRAIVAYYDGGNSGYGTAVCLTLNDDDTITTGTPFVFNSGTAYAVVITAMDSTHAIVAYEGASYGKAVCLILSDDNTITAGVAKTFDDSGYGGPEHYAITTMDSTHAIVVNNSSVPPDPAQEPQGVAYSLILNNDNTITVEDEVVFHSAGDVSYLSVTAIDSTHAVLLYLGVNEVSYEKLGCVLTLNEDDTISIGTKTLVPVTRRATKMDSTHVIASSGNEVVCLTISGNSISVGDEIIVEDMLYIQELITKDSTHAIACFRNDSNYGTAISLNLTGTTITAGYEIVFNNVLTTNIAAAMMNSTHAIVVYSDGGNSNYGTANALITSLS
jgi:hypothetical protein